MNEFFTYTDDDLTISYKYDKIPKAEDFTLHTHEWYELYYFIDGDGIYKIEGNSYPMQSGDILIMRPAEAHFIDININKPYTRMALNFSEELFRYIDKDKKLLTPFNERNAGELNLYRSSDFKNLKYVEFLQGICSSVNDCRIQITSNLLPLLNEIYIAFNEKNKVSVEETSMKEIINYINQNLLTDISLDEICRIFYMSKQQLCRSFKKATGSTVWGYITAKRLLFAKALIASGITTTKACEKAGFGDYSTFFRSYKKRYNVSPSDDSEKFTQMDI